MITPFRPHPNQHSDFRIRIDYTTNDDFLRPRRAAVDSPDTGGRQRLPKPQRRRRRRSCRRPDGHRSRCRRLSSGSFFPLLVHRFFSLVPSSQRTGESTTLRSRSKASEQDRWVTFTHDQIHTLAQSPSAATVATRQTPTFQVRGKAKMTTIRCHAYDVLIPPNETNAEPLAEREMTSFPVTAERWSFPATPRHHATDVMIEKTRRLEPSDSVRRFIGRSDSGDNRQAVSGE